MNLRRALLLATAVSAHAALGACGHVSVPSSVPGFGDDEPEPPSFILPEQLNLEVQQDSEFVPNDECTFWDMYAQRRETPPPNADCVELRARDTGRVHDAYRAALINAGWRPSAAAYRNRDGLNSLAFDKPAESAGCIERLTLSTYPQESTPTSSGAWTTHQIIVFEISPRPICPSQVSPP